MAKKNMRSSRPKKARATRTSRSTFVHKGSVEALSAELTSLRSGLGWPWSMALIDVQKLSVVTPKNSSPDIVSALRRLSFAIDVSLAIGLDLSLPRSILDRLPLRDYGPLLDHPEPLPSAAKGFLAKIVKMSPEERQRYVMFPRTCADRGLPMATVYYGDEEADVARPWFGGDHVPSDLVEHAERFWRNLLEAGQQAWLEVIRQDLSFVNGVPGTSTNPGEYEGRFEPCTGFVTRDVFGKLVIPALYIGDDDPDTAAKQWSDALYLQRIADLWQRSGLGDARDPIRQLLIAPAEETARAAELHADYLLRASLTSGATIVESRQSPPARGSGDGGVLNVLVDKVLDRVWHERLEGREGERLEDPDGPGFDGEQARKQRGKKPRGRPQKHSEKDQQVYDAWRTGEYKTRADCAHAFEIPKKEFVKRYDRHRHWLKRGNK